MRTLYARFPTGCRQDLQSALNATIYNRENTTPPERSFLIEVTAEWAVGFAGSLIVVADSDSSCQTTGLSTSLHDESFFLRKE